MMGIKSTFRRFFEMDEDIDTYEPVTHEREEKAYDNHEPAPVTNLDANRTSKVVDFKSMQHQQARVVVVEPKSYDDVQEIADYLKNRKAVVINSQFLGKSDTRRTIDFLGGTVYAINGHIQKLGADTFICTPDHIDISGVVSEVTSQSF